MGYGEKTFAEVPLIFVDSDEERMTKVLELYFSDGSIINVIDEHGFWDNDSRCYEYINLNNYTMFIGHSFKRHKVTNGNLQLENVVLVNAVVTNKFTSAWSPISYKHFSIFTNGILSIPAKTEMLSNIFTFDEHEMCYDEIEYNNDVMQIGLYSYNGLFLELAISEEIFEAFNGKYLKIAIAKGKASFSKIEYLLNKYSQYLE